MNGALVEWEIDDYVLWWLRKGILPPYEFFKDWIPWAVDMVFKKVPEGDSKPPL